MRIVVLGGTGYAGAHIVNSAVLRGHEVSSLSRNPAANEIGGVTYLYGDAADRAVLADSVARAEAVALALSPRGGLARAGALRTVYANASDLASEKALRLGVVGGAGSLLVAREGPTVAESAGFPSGLKPEAAEMAGVLDDLRARTDDLDWFVLSPPPLFGRSVGGAAAGSYRTGGDVVIASPEGASTISGPDFADAFIDEFEEPKHRRQRFTVAN